MKGLIVKIKLELRFGDSCRGLCERFYEGLSMSSTKRTLDLKIEMKYRNSRGCLGRFRIIEGGYS